MTGGGQRKALRFGSAALAMALMASMVATTAGALVPCNPRLCSGGCTLKCEGPDGKKSTCGEQYPDICIPTAVSTEQTPDSLFAGGSTATPPEVDLLDEILPIAEAPVLTCNIRICFGCVIGCMDPCKHPTTGQLTTCFAINPGTCDICP